MNIIIWGLQALVGGFLLALGIRKLFKLGSSSKKTGWFIPLMGIVEIVIALGFLLPVIFSVLKDMTFFSAVLALILMAIKGVVYLVRADFRLAGMNLGVLFIVGVMVYGHILLKDIPIINFVAVSVYYRPIEMAWQKKWDKLAPKENDMAPDFELWDTDGKNRVRLSDFKGKKPVGLIFGSYT